VALVYAKDELLGSYKDTKIDPPKFCEK